MLVASNSITSNPTYVFFGVFTPKQLNTIKTDFHTATHIYIPYTGKPQIQNITILTTDFHHIERIHSFKGFNSISILPTRIQYIRSIEGFTQLKEYCKKTL
jgi:hypothetical protein